MPVTIFLMMIERRAGHFGWLAAQSADILRSEKTTLEGRRGGGGGVGEGGREGEKACKHCSIVTLVIRVINTLTRTRSYHKHKL